MSHFPTSLKQEYARLEAERSPYLQRARDAARYTLPALIPPTGKTAGARLRSGFSNFGARCVNALASKLVLAILPARQSFFKFTVEKALEEKLGGPEQKAEIDKALASMENVVQTEIETTPTRTPIGEAAKHLLIGGNVLLYSMPEGGVKTFGLQSYVCVRDGSGNPLRIVAQEMVAPDTLPASVRGAVRAKLLERKSNDKSVPMFTGLFMQDSGMWKVWQEVEGIRVPGSEGTYTKDACPWLSLRWTPVESESYGRSMVEDYLGYFTSLEALTAALVKGTAIAAKVVYLRNPNGTTKAAALTRSETGDVIDGKVDDVQALQTEKSHDFRTARELINDIKEELSFAFALNQAIQRNAERVTAEEIRYMAQELDALLGGIYSTLSLELQRPLLRILLAKLEKEGKLPSLPKKALRPVITTGLDALGRGAELDNLRAYVKDVVDLGGPQALETYIYFDDLLTRLATSRGIQSAGLVKPKEVVAQAMEAKQQAEMVAQLGPNAVTQAGQLAKQGMAQQPTQ